MGPGPRERPRRRAGPRSGLTGGGGVGQDRRDAVVTGGTVVDRPAGGGHARAREGTHSTRLTTADLDRAAPLFMGRRSDGDVDVWRRPATGQDGGEEGAS